MTALLKWLGEHRKAVVGLVGTTVTAALGLVPAHSPTWNVLTIISVAVTAIAISAVPNVPPTPAPAA